MNLQVGIPKDSAIVVSPGPTADSPPQIVVKRMELHPKGHASGGIIVLAHAEVLAGLGDDVIRSIRSLGVGTVSVTAAPDETISIDALSELANRTRRDVVLHVGKPIGKGGEA
jgi:hypothetical protein